MRNICLLALLLAFLPSCQNQNQENDQASEETPSIDELQSQVMTVHDEAMAEMGHINDLINQLKARRDSLAEADFRPSYLDSLSGAIADLKAADQGMRQWMRGYEPAQAEPSKPEARAYLQGQMDKIKQVNEQTQQSIQQAEAMPDP